MRIGEVKVGMKVSYPTSLDGVGNRETGQVTEVLKTRIKVMFWGRDRETTVDAEQCQFLKPIGFESLR